MYEHFAREMSHSIILSVYKLLIFKWNASHQQVSRHSNSYAERMKHSSFSFFFISLFSYIIVWSNNRAHHPITERQRKSLKEMPTTTIMTLREWHQSQRQSIDKWVRCFAFTLCEMQRVYTFLMSSTQCPILSLDALEISVLVCFIYCENCIINIIQFMYYKYTLSKWVHCKLRVSIVPASKQFNSILFTNCLSKPVYLFQLCI